MVVRPHTKTSALADSVVLVLVGSVGAGSSDENTPTAGSAGVGIPGGIEVGRMV